MGRGSTRILVKRIIECLTKGPRSISNLSEETGFDRIAIAKYLQAMKDSGLLVEDQQGTSKMYSIASNYRLDTYFGLPLNAETEKMANSLFYLIKKNWKEQTTEKLLNTHAQKIAYEVIFKCKLQIPHGWYLYGGIEIVSYDDSRDYTYSSLGKDVELCVKEVTIEYANNKHAWQTKNLQYQKFGSNLYLLKEEIFSILYSPNFEVHSKNSLFVLAKKIRQLITVSPRDDAVKYKEILDSYQDLMMDIANKMDDNWISEHKREIITLFEAIWRYIALFNFKQGLSEFYSKAMLDNHFQIDISQQEDEIVELGTPLQSLIPADEITDPLKKKLYEALSQMKIVDEKRLAEQNEELENLKKKKGLKAYKEELLHRAGLK